MNPLLPATALVTTVALVAAPATAHAGKGPKEGGVAVEVISFGPGSDKTQADARRPANLVCAGMVGNRREGFKIGMEFLGCGGDRRGVGGFYGGTRLHWGGLLGPLRIGGGAGVGMGGLNDRSDLTGDRWSTFFYVKPGLTAGLQLGGVGLEIEAFAFLPVHMMQVVQVDTTQPYRIATPGAGARVSVLFGKSRKRIREEEEALERARKLRADAIKAQREAEAARAELEAMRRAQEAANAPTYAPSPYDQPAPERPLAVPGPSPEPPPPVQEGGAAEPPPLAIPAGPTY